MSTSEIRRKAREALAGKWGKAICILLAYMLIIFAIGFVEGLFENSGFLFLLIEIAVLIITIPLSFGLLISFMKFRRGENVKAFGFIQDGFANFNKSWGIAWHTFVKMLLPVACIVLVVLLLSFSIGFGAVSGNYVLTISIAVLYIATLIYTISRGLLYTVAYNIGYDRPELSAKECVLTSEQLMKGNRGTFFLLELSFIGWGILAAFTFGIGLLWLAPYMSIAEVCFYEKVAKIEE